MMIRPNRIVFLLLLIAFVQFGCEKDVSEPDAESSEQQNIDQTDDSPPVVSISTTNRLIETPSQVTYEITDDSSIVALKVFLNGEPYTQEDLNTISIDIDPFDFPEGNLEIKVIAEDAHGNVQEAIDIFQIRKLLLRIPASNISDAYYLEHYVLINAVDGSLKQVIKLEPFEDASIYAPEDFRDSTFTVSLFSYTNDLNPNNYCSMYSYEAIERGAVLPTIESVRLQKNQIERPDLDREQNLSITTDNPEKPAWISGLGYWNESLPEDDTNLRYSSDIAPKFFVRHHSSRSVDTRDSFKYFWLQEPFVSNYGTDDFLLPESFIEVDIPTEMRKESQGNFACFVYGYESEEHYQKRISHDILALSTSGNTNIFKDACFLPVINEFEVYDKVITGTVGAGYSWSTKQKGLQFRPLPDMSVRKTDNRVTSSGDYDEILFEYASYNVEQSNFRSFNWRYYSRPTDEIIIPYGAFELPEEIVQILLDRELEPKSETNDGTGSSVSLIKFKEYSDYSNRLFEHNWHYLFPEWSRLKLNLNP